MSSSSPRLTFVIGGARSGKSRLAEQIVTAEAEPWTYVATAEVRDDEMRQRIAAHQARRADGWRTIEAPFDIVGALHGDAPALVDCLTLWLTNLMLAERDVGAETEKLIRTLSDRGAPTVVVANEVGLGIVPDNALARGFRDEAGRLNQRIAAVAGRVLFVAAGLPMTLKG